MDRQVKRPEGGRKVPGKTGVAFHREVEEGSFKGESGGGKAWRKGQSALWRIAMGAKNDEKIPHLLAYFPPSPVYQEPELEVR